MLYKAVWAFQFLTTNVVRRWYMHGKGNTFNPLWNMRSRLCSVTASFKPMDDTLECNHSNVTYQTVLSRGAVSTAIQGGYYFKTVNGKLACDHLGNKINFYTNLYRCLTYIFSKHPVVVVLIYQTDSSFHEILRWTIRPPIFHISIFIKKSP